MHRNGHTGWNVRDRGVDHARIDERQSVGIIAPGAHLIAQRRIARIGEVNLVELQVTASRVRKRTNDRSISCAEIAIEIVHRCVDRFRDGLAAVAEMQRRRRRNRPLGRRLGVPREETKMLDHRVIGTPAELAVDTQQDRPRLRALKLELALTMIGFDAAEPEQEIGLPGGAAILSVRDGMQADLFLSADQCDDLLILDRAQCVGIDFTALAPGARFLEGCAAQEATDMVGTEGRRSAEHGHPHTSRATSTTKRSFAHCSSSLSTLPSSVEANPHCGDSASCSSATYFVASSMRRLMSSLFSSAASLDDTRPSTTIFLPFGT